MGIYDDLPCSIGDVVDLVGLHVVRNTGTQLYCRCPFCNDTKAHLNVRLDKNVFRCNRCGKGGGILHLYAEINDVSLHTAYDELCRIYRSDESIPSRAHKPRIRDVIVNQELDLAPASVRHNTYSNLLSLLTLGSSHRESLRKRGLSDEEIDRLEYRTTPAIRASKIVTELLERGCELKGVPGFYVDKETGKLKMDIRASGIMVPDRNCHGQIEALQIRLDKVYKSKFNTLTSVDKYCGTTASCCPHFVGLGKGDTSVYLTEGVMKSDIAHFLSCELGHPIAFVGLTGVGNINQFLRSLEELRAMGIQTIKVAFDMDAQVNENVQKARERVLSVGCKSGFEMVPKNWDPAFKGIDDLLLSFWEKRQTH